ncbi:2-oxo acid dehydrogenase subunit E2, partial [Burkholderia cenocepacia]|uniref:biotin/lipoyl-containing protein n=1 Tax=Burkholderia cenocepacia TaxID=95486 RepID=UPI001BA3EB20|nr:2-oxo acid dehydrogenase subunit E2 [Burkholderia cenocepacia]
MGIHVIKMPDIGEGIAEVELVAWHVEVGQTIKEDQPLADVMTDKAAVEIPSPVTGKVIELGGRIGEMMAVGSELIRLEVEGDGNLKAAAPVQETKVATAPVEAPAPSKPAADTSAEPPAQPAAPRAPAKPRREEPA